MNKIKTFSREHTLIKLNLEVNYTKNHKLIRSFQGFQALSIEAYNQTQRNYF